MTKQTWTPGPWIEPRVYRNPGGMPYHIAVYADGGRKHVHDWLESDSGGINYDDALSNARLIALAPEMAEALRAVVDCYGVETKDPQTVITHLAALVDDARAILEKLDGAK